MFRGMGSGLLESGVSEDFDPEKHRVPADAWAGIDKRPTPEEIAAAEQSLEEVTAHLTAGLSLG